MVQLDALNKCLLKGSISKIMDSPINELEPSTSNLQSPDLNEGPSNLIRVPKVVLERIDDLAVFNFQTTTPSKKSNKRRTQISDKVQKVLKKSPNKNIDTNAKHPRPRGRPKKDVSNLSVSKKNSVQLGVKNKTAKSNKPLTLPKKNNIKLGVKIKTLKPNEKQSKDNLNSQSKPKKLLNKNVLQKRSKVTIPPHKKTKGIPTKAIQAVSSADIKPSPPKPKLEIIQSKPGENSSDTSGDEFLYDELIEELENTASKRTVEAKPVPEKTTITLKPNTGNKPPTVLKGGIVKRTDLPSDLNLFASVNKTPSNVLANGKQKSKQTSVLTPGGKRKSSDIFGQPKSAKKSSPWPVALIQSPKKSSATNLNSQKKKNLMSKVGVSQVTAKPTKIISPKTMYSPLTSPDVLPKPSHQIPITAGVQKAKIGPKQTAKVVPLAKSFDADDYLSDEYLEEETLEYDVEDDQVSKQSPIKSNPVTSNLSTNGPIEGQNTNVDLLRILTDDSEEPIKAKAKEKPVISEVDALSSSKVEKAPTKELMGSCLDKTIEQKNDVENEEAPVRTIYDVMNEVFLNYPSWNLHLIPETSAFCIAQVTKGRLGLPTLKKCIELDPESYNAKVYIHQYHIKRFDGVYDGEESILALIREIDSIKA